jgi:hypothetical protein
MAIGRDKVGWLFLGLTLLDELLLKLLDELESSG